MNTRAVSMFGVKVHLRHPIALLLCLLIVVILIVGYRISPKKSEIHREQWPPDTGEDIHLLDLFNAAFELTYRAGKSIRLLKHSKENNERIKQKQVFQQLPNEPVTQADLLSHTIITTGLKQQFHNLRVVSEEKADMNSKELRALQRQFKVDGRSVKLPSIKRDNDLMTVPMSSVAVWVDPLDATKEFTENLLQYVMVMLCVTVDREPTIGILYAPFTEQWAWGWVNVARSPLDRDPAILQKTHEPGIDDIIISRSHAGRAHEILRDIYRDAQYKLIPAAGSGYKTVQVLQEIADFYLHVTPIKKWDVCAPDAVLRANHGRLTTLKNQTISYNADLNDMLITDGLLATYKRNHNDVLKRLGNLTRLLSH